MRKQQNVNDFAPWRAPTGDTQGQVIVVPGERTCLACGETFCGQYCERCGPREPDLHTPRKAPPPSVATLGYLRAGEYAEVRL